MKTIKRAKVLGHDIYLRIGKRTTVTGINSQVGDGESVLFWEFDRLPFETVREILEDIQWDNRLPNIYILQASTQESWHAVSMKRHCWLLALSIVAGTPGVDPDYVRLAAYREHFTLRLTDKGQGEPRLAHVLESPVPADACLGDFIQGVRYGAWQR